MTHVQSVTCCVQLISIYPPQVAPFILRTQFIMPPSHFQTQHNTSGQCLRNNNNPYFPVLKTMYCMVCLSCTPGCCGHGNVLVCVSCTPGCCGHGNVLSVTRGRRDTAVEGYTGRESVSCYPRDNDKQHYSPLDVATAAKARQGSSRLLLSSINHTSNT